MQIHKARALHTQQSYHVQNNAESYAQLNFQKHFFFVEEKLHNYPPLSCYVFLFLFFLPFFFELGDCGSTVDMTESNLCIDADSNDGDTAA